MYGTFRIPSTCSRPILEYMWHGTVSWDSFTDGTRCRWKYYLGTQAFSVVDTVREAFIQNDHEGNNSWTGSALTQGSEPIWVCVGTMTHGLGTALCEHLASSPHYLVSVWYTLWDCHTFFVLWEQSVLLDSMYAFRSKQNMATGWMQQQIEPSCS